MDFISDPIERDGSLEPTLRAEVKVVDSKGVPVEGISIAKYTRDDAGIGSRYVLGKTNSDGIIPVNLDANSYGQFLAWFEHDKIIAEIQYEIGGLEDSGREFKIVIPE